MKARLLLICGVLLVAMLAGTSTGIRSAKAATTSTLSVVGNQLVDNGNVVVLRGVNRSGAEYACWQNFGFFDGPSDDPSIAAIAAWGVNAVRVPFNESCWLGINGVPAAYSGANYRAAITGFVTRLRAHGLYVILDNSAAGPGTTIATTILPMPDADHAPALWTSVASTFASDKGVIFDLYNEPHDVPWSCWANGCLVTGGVNWVANYQAAGMNSLTAAVRGTGATNVILIAGLSWSYDIGGWLANRPSDTQLIAGIHNYGVSGWDTPAIWTNIYAPTALQVPVTFGEMGFDVYVEKIMTWADAHGIGYLAWTWDTWGNQEALISNYNGTPTTYGLGFKNYLASITPPPPAPTVGSLAPTGGPAAGGTPVTITGTNLAGATSVKFGTATASYTVNSATQISATSPAGSGTVNVTVTTAGGTSAISGADQFTYAAPPPPPAPTVTVVAPSSGTTAGGTPVTITGTNLTGASAVRFGSTTASYTINSATQISTTSPAGSAGTVHVTVTTTGGTSATSSADQFSYVAPPPPVPTVTVVAPNSGTTAGGTPVTITGTGFTGASAVRFGSATAAFTINSATQISATSPAGTGTVHVTVTTTGGTSATSGADQFTYVAPPPPAPTVTAVAPNSGPSAGGTPVTITGTSFTGATSVMFGGAIATFTVSSATQIATTSPPGSGSVNVMVTTPAGSSSVSSADQFTYTAPPPPAPTVTSLSLTSGPSTGGTPVTITGSGFTGASAVRFGSATAAFTVNSATQISATSPAGTGTIDVTVTTTGGTSATSGADQFTYVAPPPPAPTVTAVAPNSGPTAGGTLVTITGTSFTGATSVMFGGATAAFTVSSATQIAATSPAGSGTVNVTVTTPAGSSAVSSADQFTYPAPPPPPPPPGSLGGVLSQAPAASSWGASRVDVFAVGTDSGLYQRTWNGSSWSAWAPLGGRLTSRVAAVSWGPNRIDVFGRGTDNALYHRYWDSSGWHNWEGLGGRLLTGAAVASWGNGRLDVFAVGTDNGLYHKWFDAGVWHEWEGLGGRITADPGAVSWGPNRVDVFARGTDNAIYHRWLDTGGWHGWEGLGGNLISGPAASSCAAGHLDVFAVGTDSALHRIGFNGGWGAWQGLGGQWTSDPGAVCPPATSTVDLFERGTDLALWETTVAPS